jgi:hypothetical protein
MRTARSALMIVGFLISSAAFWAQEPATIDKQMSTEDRLRKPGWWPTKGAPLRNEYVGPATCAQCHSAIAATQKRSAMASAGTNPANSSVLLDHQLSLHLRPYTYAIKQSGGKSQYSVSDPTKTSSVPLALAVGGGSRVGQTYLFEKNGTYFESRVSYFGAIQGLDLTPGHTNATPQSLEAACGRPLSGAEVHRCFACHTTASTTNYTFDPQNLVPGVTCESCHGPGAKHVTAMRARAGAEGEGGETLIFNPRRLTPSDSVDFCGACHRTWWDVSSNKDIGILNLRFAPYRLEKSRCWAKGDARITCVACHDPHKPLVEDPAFYDQRCLACHAKTNSSSTAEHMAAVCPISEKDCVSCHMPKYDIPGMHYKFTDHWIRVAKAGAPYPD